MSDYQPGRMDVITRRGLDEVLIRFIDGGTGADYEIFLPPEAAEAMARALIRAAAKVRARLADTIGETAGRA